MNQQTQSSVEIMKNRMNGGFPGGADRATTQIAMNEMPITVTIDQLRPSDVLPRLKRNELYEDIKLSIREKGLDHAPVITKLPDQDGYVISDGGNTRLQILKELYEETGDTKFYTINCLFRPWRGELKSIIGHLTENGLRDDYTFIEKALGVVKSKNLYEKELGTTLSARELSERLKKDGYPISNSLISKMLNTVEYLYPYMSETLKLGLGKGQIDKILQLRTVCLDLYHRSAKFDDDEAFNEVFNFALSNCDLEPKLFNIQHLQDDMFGSFSKKLDIKYNIFEYELNDKKQKGTHFPLKNIYESSVKNETNIQNGSDSYNSSAKPNANDSNQTIKNDILANPRSTNEVLQKSLSNEGTQQHSDNLNQQNKLNVKQNNDDDSTHIFDEQDTQIDISHNATNESDFKQVFEQFANNTDFKKQYPKAFSLTANINTYGKTERVAVLDIWELTDDTSNHVDVFGEILGNIHDICDELRIDRQIANPFDYDEVTKKTAFKFNPLSEAENAILVKRTAYQIITNLLINQPDSESINFNYLVSQFSDFVVIKVLRIIRLKRVYDSFVNKI